MTRPPPARASIASRKATSGRAKRPGASSKRVEKPPAVIVKTAGGPFFNRRVNAGRDVHIVSRIEGKIDTRARPKALLATYYRSLASECRALPLGLIDPQFVKKGGNDGVPLSEVYIDLDVTTPPRVGEKDEREWARHAVRGAGDRTPLLKALSDPAVRRVVLLGDAGTGKTSFVNNLTCLAIDQPNALPKVLRTSTVIRLVLRELAVRRIPDDATEGQAQMLWDGLHDDIEARVSGAGSVLMPYLREQLETKGGVILLDGLDEVPEANRRRATLLAAIRELSDAVHPIKGRIILTARPYAYADRSWQLARFPVLSLAPFSLAQCERFVTRFYAAVRASIGWSEETAMARAGRLTDALRGKPYLADLGNRPLLLTLMATLNATRGTLPEDRAELLDDSIELLLGRCQRGREVTGRDKKQSLEPGLAERLKVDEMRIRPALEQLALTVHDQQQATSRAGDETADISEGDLLVAFKALLGPEKPETLFGYLSDRAGLLDPRREGVYAFPHRSFQEYLAACELLNKAEYAQEIRARASASPGWWREVLLLAVGKLKKGSFSSAVDLVNALLPDSPADVQARTDTDWHRARLAGLALLELRRHERASGHGVFDALERRCRQWLVRLLEDGHLSPRDRAEAGDVLGQLGDQRFESTGTMLPICYRGTPEPARGFVEVPAGLFVMGSREGDRDAQESEFGNPLRLDMPYRYWIARYPVIVGQYGVFIADQGYENPVYWTEIGLAWKAGSWDSKVKEDWLREHLKRRSAALRQQPMWWSEFERYANRPIVGVSWFEAYAYTRWLDAKLRADAPRMIEEGYCVRLPTEAEWEKAARNGDARRFPWGNDDWNEAKANLHPSIGTVTSVGAYPAGAAPGDLHDFAGNVWEWTGSLYGAYPYRADERRNDPSAHGFRVVRGGSWIDDPRVARCAARYWYVPGFYVDYCGFRLVVSLANSDF